MLIADANWYNIHKGDKKNAYLNVFSGISCSVTFFEHVDVLFCCDHWFHDVLMVHPFVPLFQLSFLSCSTIMLLFWCICCYHSFHWYSIGYFAVVNPPIDIPLVPWINVPLLSSLIPCCIKGIINWLFCCYHSFHAMPCQATEFKFNSSLLKGFSLKSM